MINYFRLHHYTDVEREQFSQMYEIHFDAVYRFIYLHVGNQAIAEDLTSSTFEDAYKKFYQYLEQGKSLHWLLKMAGYHIKKHYRRDRIFNKYRHKIYTEDSVDDRYEDQADALKMLAMVSNDEKTLLIMRYIEEFSIEEIQSATGYTKNNIYVKCSRAIKKILDKISQEDRHA